MTRFAFGRSGRIFFSLASALMITACGSSYNEHDVKDYRLAVDSNDDSIKDAFEKMISEFNSEVGLNALRFVNDPADANSQIILTRGLNARDGKVGWGQWIRTTESDSPVGSLLGETPDRTNVYSMRLEFDLEYVTARMDSSRADRYYEFRKLFYHEVGHGLQMDHDPNPQALMYYDISGTKDFNGYVKRVQQYLTN
jgi:hypothetical protein